MEERERRSIFRYVSLEIFVLHPDACWSRRWLALGTGFLQNSIVKISKWSLALFAVVVSLGLLGCQSPASRPSGGPWVIGPDSVGPIRKGMTVTEVRAVLDRGCHVVAPMARPIMVSDAEFVVRDAAGRDVAAFEMADTFNPLAAGNVISRVIALGAGVNAPGRVHPGMRIADAARIYGPAELSMEMEATGLEMLRFRNQPAFLTISPSRNAGIFSDPPRSGISVTENYRPDAVIARIATGGSASRPR